MHGNLEQRTNGKGTILKGARTIFIAAAVAWGGYQAGKVNEAKNHSLEHKQIRKGIYELVSEEGYHWKKESDHTFFEYNTMVMTDPTTKEMWGIFAKSDSTHTGRIRYDGKVGEPLAGKIQEYTQQEWNEIKRNSKSVWERTKNWFQEKWEYARTDRKAEE